jgi:hypothetical protein
MDDFVNVKARSLISLYGGEAITMAMLAASKAHGVNLKKIAAEWVPVIAAIKGIQRVGLSPQAAHHSPAGPSISPPAGGQ